MSIKNVATVKDAVCDVPGNFDHKLWRKVVDGHSPWDICILRDWIEVVDAFQFFCWVHHFPVIGIHFLVNVDPSMRAGEQNWGGIVQMSDRCAEIWRQIVHEWEKRVQTGDWCWSVQIVDRCDVWVSMDEAVLWVGSEYGWMVVVLPSMKKDGLLWREWSVAFHCLCLANVDNQRRSPESVFFKTTTSQQ